MRSTVEYYSIVWLHLFCLKQQAPLCRAIETLVGIEAEAPLLGFEDKCSFQKPHFLHQLISLKVSPDQPFIHFVRWVSLLGIAGTSVSR
jgi:hypothetical protein